MNSFFKNEYKLSRNPFPPAASGGIDSEKEVYVPSQWKEKVENFYAILSKGRGPKAFPIMGEYGSGKTYLLKGYLKNFFEKKNIKTFYFENPGVKFYDLANTLLRTLGRYEFSKALWEICKEHLSEEKSLSLFPMSFAVMLSSLRTSADRKRKAQELAYVIKEKLALTDDEEIAYKLGLVVAETSFKPYFSYRDFVAGTEKALVAEREETKYFKAIIKAIIAIYGVDGVVFLIDEFEEIAFPKRMTRKQTYEYLATLRSLIDISAEENLWIVIAMTPEAADETKKMNPALWERFTHYREETILKLEPLSVKESEELLIWWLNIAREDNGFKHYRGKIFPFPDNIKDVLVHPEIILPRALVKIGFYVLARAESQKLKAPIPLEFVESVINKLYPPHTQDNMEDKNG